MEQGVAIEGHIGALKALHGGVGPGGEDLGGVAVPCQFGCACGPACVEVGGDVARREHPLAEQPIRGLCSHQGVEVQHPGRQVLWRCNAAISWRDEQHLLQ